MTRFGALPVPTVIRLAAGHGTHARKQSGGANPPATILEGIWIGPSQGISLDGAETGARSKKAGVHNLAGLTDAGLERLPQCRAISN